MDQMRNERAYGAQSREVVTSRTECPYGAVQCPKVRDLEEKVTRMESRQMAIMRLLYLVVGVVSASLGVQIL